MRLENSGNSCSVDGAMFEVYFDSAAMAKAEGHFRQAAAKRMEAIGFFLGSVHSWKGEKFVRATDYVTAENDSTSVSVRFATGAFPRLAERITGKGLIVAWAHSHPGFGAFMSETDVRTHESCFDGEYNYALVIDPVRGEKKVFKVDGGEVREASFAVVEKRK